MICGKVFAAFGGKTKVNQDSAALIVTAGFRWNKEIAHVGIPVSPAWKFVEYPMINPFALIDFIGDGVGWYREAVMEDEICSLHIKGVVS